MTVETGPARIRIFTPVTRRRPMRLDGASPMHDLVRLGWYPASVAERGAAIRQVFAALKAAARTGDWDGVDRHTLVMPLQGIERRVRVSFANTQFIALDRAIFPFGYEPEVEVLLDRLVPDDGVFLDVGANWGYFSLFLASRPGFRGRIHAFEPAAGTYDDLSRVVGGMGLSDTIRCHRMAVGDADGTVSFSEALFSGVSALSGAGPAEETVRLARLDDLALPPPDVIKLDVEGGEAAALRGAAGLLRDTRPVVIFEYWQSENPQCRAPLDILAAHGYSFFVTAWHDGRTGTIERQLSRDDDRLVLVLTSFTAEEYALLPTHVNVIACPTEKVGKVPGFNGK